MAPPDLRWAAAATLVAEESAARGAAAALAALTAQLATRSRQALSAGSPAGSAEASAEQAELAGSTRAAVEAAAAACGAVGDGHGGAFGPPTVVALEVAAACRAARRLLLPCRQVARTLREFVGGLLYLALTGEPREEAVGTWAAHLRLAAFLSALCGVSESGSDSGGGPVAGDSGGHASGQGPPPCPECACRNLVIQEALSLLRYVFRFARKADSASTNLSLHFEDGVCQLLATLRGLIATLHPACHAAIHGATADSLLGSLAWRVLHRELERVAAEASMPLVVAPLAARALRDFGAEAVRLEECATGRPRGPNMRYAGTQAFATFPPALLARPAVAGGSFADGGLGAFTEGAFASGIRAAGA